MVRLASHATTVAPTQRFHTVVDNVLENLPEDDEVEVGEVKGNTEKSTLTAAVKRCPPVAKPSIDIHTVCKTICRIIPKIRVNEVSKFKSEYQSRVGAQARGDLLSDLKRVLYVEFPSVYHGIVAVLSEEVTIDFDCCYKKSQLEDAIGRMLLQSNGGVEVEVVDKDDGTPAAVDKAVESR